MQNESKERLETIFHAACSRPAGGERHAYLDGACEGDADLRSRVDVLLAAHDEASGFLDAPAVESKREGPGSTIGPYKLLQEIGEGGMGVVYMAQQEHPVRRKVALKVIKLGMDTKQVIARFEAERQALAMMEHTNIARVLDAGATEAGRPYFVMELVRGVPIDEYCDAQKLSTEERLALFVDVCRAVQHAHQKGIIHRDIKPTNVLVTSHDGVPIPKIIDFGVAKATNQRLTERTLFTEFHQIIGTPEYMSPEQAEMSGTDVDTRSDIYSLGVLLYRLLTGTTPVDAKALRTAGFQEMTRMIREDEPQAPSTRISKLGPESDEFGKHRRSDAGALSRQARGDLDWIVMKAIEKDRTRRYETASAFAEDVVRHLANRPVEAGPPGSLYRARKFVHRNRKAVAAAGLLSLAIALGLAGTLAGFLKARGEAERSGRVSDALQDVLAITDTTSAASRGAVEASLLNVRDVFGEEHATYAAVLDTLAMRMHDAGDFERAVELFEESLAIWKQLHGERHPNVANTLAHLGGSLRARGENAKAEDALRAALGIFDGISDAPGLAGYDARVALAELLANRGAYTEADELLGQSLAILAASPTPLHFQTLQVLERRVGVQLAQTSMDATETLQALYDETRAFYPDDNPLLAITALGYGRYLAQHGDQEGGATYLREAVQRFRAHDDPPVVYFVTACDSLFQILRNETDEAKMIEADDLLRDIIEYGADLLGVDGLVSTQRYYSIRLMERGHDLPALETMLAGHKVLLDAGRDLDERETMRDGLTFVAAMAARKPGLDASVYVRALEAIERALLDEPEHPAMRVVHGMVLYRQGEFESAAEALDLAKPLSKYSGGLARKLSPGDHAFRAMASARLGDLDLARAELALLRKAVERKRENPELSAILREAEALIEPDSSSGEDD